MRVENQPSQGVTDSSRTSAARSAGSETVGTGHQALSTSGTDQVSLSSASSLLSLAKSIPSPKQSRVEALTSQYAAGNYRPSSTDVSRSLLQSLQSN